MIKPANFDNVKVGSGQEKIILGGHKAVIIGVQERKNKNGGDMLVVAIDFAKDDKQPGYFAEQFKNNDRENKKWPYTGTQYINVVDKDGSCSRSFKSFCACYAESNGCDVNWEAADFCAQFKGKSIGAVYGLVEDEYNGKRYKRAQLRWFTNAKNAAEAKAPDDKLLPAVEQAPVSQADEFIPF